MKVMFVLQYFPYQYEQFKPLIDELGADAFYRIHTDNQTQYFNSKVFDVNTGNPVHYKDIPQDKYDCLVYTGTWCESLLKFADKCKYKNIVCMSHSLIGSLYDIGIVTAAHPRAVGFVPEAWLDFPSFHKRCSIIQEEDGNTKYVVSKSHPIAMQALMAYRSELPDERTLGVILGHKSPFKHFSEIVDRLVKENGFAKVKVKLHPLTDDSVIEEYWNKPYISVLPKSYDKYDWLDSCGYVIGGCSSLLIEEILRAMYFNSGQKFKQFPFKRRGIPLDIEDDTSKIWSTHSNMFEGFSTLNCNDNLWDHIRLLQNLVEGNADIKEIY